MRAEYVRNSGLPVGHLLLMPVTAFCSTRCDENPALLALRKATVSLKRYGDLPREFAVALDVAVLLPRPAQPEFRESLRESPIIVIALPCRGFLKVNCKFAWSAADPERS